MKWVCDYKQGGDINDYICNIYGNSVTCFATSYTNATYEKKFKKKQTKIIKKTKKA